MKVPRITLPVDAPALARGVGFFETLWVTGGRVIFFDEHLERLAGACRALGVPELSAARVHTHVRSALRGRAGTGSTEMGMRWSYLAAGRDLDDPRSWKFFAMVFPIPREILRKRKGVRAILLPVGWERATPRWKTIDYRTSIAGGRLAGRRAAEEGIFVDAQSRVREGTATNVFALAGNRALTPPVSAGILPGVVRGWVIRNAKRVGLRIEEGSFSSDRLRSGAFLTSSLTGIARLETLGGKPCREPGPLFAKLRDLYLSEADRGNV